MSDDAGRAFRPRRSPCEEGCPAAVSTRRARRCSSPRASSTSRAEQAEAAFKDEIEKFIYSPLRQPDGAHVRGAAAPARGRRGLLRHRVGHVGGLGRRWPRSAARATGSSRSRALFGSCFVIIDEILPRFGVETVFVDGPDLAQWEEALSRADRRRSSSRRRATRCRSSSTSRRSAGLAHAAGAKVVVDNVFGTPVFSRPLDLGADVVVYSATKHIDGQGRVLGGAVLGTAEFVDGPVKNLMRHTGPALSPFNAWVLVKGLETMALRVRQMARQRPHRSRAHLESQPRRGQRVVYPLLDEPPAARARPAPDDRRRHRRDVRRRGRQGRRRSR